MWHFVGQFYSGHPKLPEGLKRKIVVGNYLENMISQAISRVQNMIHSRT